ncbi:MAG: hypothetical protein KatS3mg060_3638 [Dehalococcoidia bacterium]|nr:MAG: hypothetical protein KatS3mg060_3638 [Dehalococcoidia bacterium]
MILTPEPLAAVLAGQKTIESRFATDRRLPWGRVGPGDRLWLKQSGGRVVAVAEAAWVQFYADLTPAAVAELFRQYPAIRAGLAYQAAKASARFGSLIGLNNIRRLDPFALRGRGRSGWRLLEGPPIPLRD